MCALIFESCFFEQCVEYLLRILQVKKISFTSYDLASDEIAKRLWKRKAPLGNARCVPAGPNQLIYTSVRQAAIARGNSKFDNAQSVQLNR